MTSLRCLGLMIACFLLFARATTITSSVAAAGVGLAVNMSPCSNQGCYTTKKPENGTNEPRRVKSERQNRRTITPPYQDACSQRGQEIPSKIKMSRSCSCANPTSKSPCTGKHSQLYRSAPESTFYDGKSSLDLAHSLRAPKAPLESILALGVAMGFLLCLA